MNKKTILLALLFGTIIASTVGFYPSLGYRICDDTPELSGTRLPLAEPSCAGPTVGFPFSEYYPSPTEHITGSIFWSNLVFWWVVSLGAIKVISKLRNRS